MFEMVPWRRNNNGVQKRGDLFEDMVNSFFDNDFLVPSKVFGNNFLVDLKALEDNITLMELKLSVPSKNQAVSLCKKWKDNPSDLYNKIINLLFTDDNTQET